MNQLKKIVCTKCLHLVKHMANRCHFLFGVLSSSKVVGFLFVFVLFKQNEHKLTTEREPYSGRACKGTSQMSCGSHPLLLHATCDQKNGAEGEGEGPF